MRKIALIVLFLLFLAGCQNKGKDIPKITPEPVTSTVAPINTPSPTPVTVLTSSVVYQPVEINGTTRIVCREGNGIEIDLDGNGVLEQIYTAQEGIYINGILQELSYKWKPISKPYATEYYQMWEEYYVVDLDKSDKQYNLVFFYETADDCESITYYDGKLIEIYSMSTLGSRRPFSDAEYYGDGTLMVKDAIVDFLGIQYGADLIYRVNGKKLERVDSFIPTSVSYELELLEEIEVYSEPDLSSEAFVIHPQTVYGLGSMKEWAKLRLTDETEVWLHKKNVSGEGSILDNGKNAYEVFDGYPNAG